MVWCVYCFGLIVNGVVFFFFVFGLTFKGVVRF